MNAELQKLWNENKDFLRRKGIESITDHNGYNRMTTGYEYFLGCDLHPDDRDRLEVNFARMREIWDAVQHLENL
jgi:hypothetical protein